MPGTGPGIATQAVNNSATAPIIAHRVFIGPSSLIGEILARSGEGRSRSRRISERSLRTRSSIVAALSSLAPPSRGYSPLVSQWGCSWAVDRNRRDFTGKAGTETSVSFDTGSCPGCDRGKGAASCGAAPCREVSAVPAELLRLAGGLLGNPDVDERRAAEVHRLLQGALQVLRLLDEEALAAERLHHLVVASAIDQRVRLQVLERLVRHFRVPRADAAVVEDDDLDWQLIAADRLHLHAGEADRRVARDRDDRLVGVHHRGGGDEAPADAPRAVAAGIAPVPRLRIEQLGAADIHRAGTLADDDRVFRRPRGGVPQAAGIVGPRSAV